MVPGEIPGRRRIPLMKHRRGRPLMTIQQAKRRFQSIEADLDRAMDRGFDKVLDRGVTLAKGRSRGKNSPADLARKDHPYATRHGSPQLDASKINKQTGGFESDWYRQRIAASMGSRSGAIINDNPVADFLKHGTGTMFPRPVGEAVEKKLEAEAESIVAKEITRVLSRHA